MLRGPCPRSVMLAAHWPDPLAIVVPTRTPPSRIEMVAPASAVPAMDWMRLLLVAGLVVMTGPEAAVVSIASRVAAERMRNPSASV